MSANPGGGWYVRGEGWAVDERPFQKNIRVHSDLREGFIGWRNETTEFTLGRRIISWGRADRINPTDVINARDYTRLFPEDEQQKLGGTAVTLSHAFGAATVTALWLPEFRASIYPIPPVSGLSFRQGADRFEPDQMAVRLDYTGNNLDWSVTYFRGLNRNPAARVEQISTTAIAIGSVYNRMQVVGADFASTLRGFGLRGEAAYTQSAVSGDTVFSPRSFLKTVVGVDRDLTRGLNVNAQYVFQQVFAYADPARGPDFTLNQIAIKTSLLNNQRLRIQHGPAVRIGYTALNDTLTLEVSALAFLSDGSYAVRPRATYALTDHVRLIAGADVFRGTQDSYFGQLQKNTLFFSEIQYSF